MPDQKPLEEKILAKDSASSALKEAAFTPEEPQRDPRSAERRALLAEALALGIDIEALTAASTAVSKAQVSSSPAAKGRVAVSMVKFVAWTILAGGIIAAVLTWYNLPSSSFIPTMIYDAQVLTGFAWLGGGLIGCAVLLAVASVADSMIAVRRAVERIDRHVLEIKKP
jgi:predicted amino acid dehydrogenase